MPAHAPLPLVVMRTRFQARQKRRAAGGWRFGIDAQLQARHQPPLPSRHFGTACGATERLGQPFSNEGGTNVLAIYSQQSTLAAIIAYSIRHLLIRARTANLLQIQA